MPSQGGGKVYTVILDERDAACDSPDFELRGEVGKPCKHIMAARLWRSRQERGTAQDRDTSLAPKVQRPTYRKD